MVTRRFPALGCVLGLAAVLALASCVPDTPSISDRSDDPTDAATPVLTDAAEIEVIAVYEAYWTERVRVETSGDYDSADFTGMVMPEVNEVLLARYDDYAAMNLRRVGEPELRDYVAQVEGETAIATVCLNEDDWGVVADAEVVPAEPLGWVASSRIVELVDGTWLIGGAPETPPDITC